MNTPLERQLTECTEPQLRAMLAVIQARLGRPDELAGDLELARAIGHQLNNLLTATRLAEDLARLPHSP